MSTRTFSFAVTVVYTGTFEMDEEELADWTEDDGTLDLDDYAMDYALDMPQRKEIEDVQVEEVKSRV